MRIEYYDADTHDLVRRDAYSQALVNALRERDEARAELAEIRHIVTETLPDLADQPDRETTVRRVAALATRYQYERDAAALLRKDVDRWEATSQAQAIEEHKLRADYERVAHLLDGAVHTTDIEAAAKAIADGFELHQGEDDTRTTEIVRDILRENTRPLNQTPPTVNLTDIEAASYDVCAANYPGGIDSDRAEEVLRNHTRAVSVESVAQAIMDAWQGRPGFDVRFMREDEKRREQVFEMARAALRAIGARLAEPTQPVEPKPEPAQLPVCARCGRFACACGCEPAKVRVKLPRFAVMARHEIVTALRSQGVEVEE